MNLFFYPEEAGSRFFPNSSNFSTTLHDITFQQIAFFRSYNALQ